MVGFGQKDVNELSWKYNNLYEAKYACSLDRSCKWVINRDCSNKAFKTYSENIGLEEIEAACVYAKTENTGK